MATKHATMKTSKKPATRGFRERCEAYLLADREKLEQLHLSKRLLIAFTKRSTVPLLSRIALWVIRKQGGAVSVHMQDLLSQK